MATKSYNDVIREAVRRKWKTPEQKEWWYGKLSAARRRKTIYWYNVQNGKCCFCGEQTFLNIDANAASDAPLPKKRLATLEHKVVQKNGGTDHLNNVAMSCHGCNNARGVMEFDQFLKVRSDPERWEAFLRRRVGLKGSPNSHAAREKASKKQVKRQARLQRRAWEIALLLWLRPDLKPVIEAAIARIVAIEEGRQRWRRERLEAKREQIS